MFALMLFVAAFFRLLTIGRLLDGNDDPGDDDDKREKRRKKVRASDYDGLDARALAAKLADALEERQEVIDENAGYREKNRTLRTQLAEAQKKIPAEGALVLTGDDAKAWETFKALGKPDEVAAAVKKAGELEGEIVTIRTDEKIRDAAAAMGWKFNVLKDRDPSRELAYEVKIEKDDRGQDAKRVYVKAKDGQTKLLDEYAKEHWGDYLIALADTGGAQPGQPVQRTAGIIVPPQGPARTVTTAQGGTRTIGQNYISRKYGGGSGQQQQS